MGYICPGLGVKSELPHFSSLYHQLKETGISTRGFLHPKTGWTNCLQKQGCKQSPLQISAGAADGAGTQKHWRGRGGDSLRDVDPRSCKQEKSITSKPGM